jgi:hypothetical protein
MSGMCFGMNRSIGYNDYTTQLTPGIGIALAFSCLSVLCREQPVVPVGPWSN